MLEKITNVPAGIDALKAVGTISKEDYEQVVETLLDEAQQQGRRIRLLMQVGPEYQGFTPGVVWEKMSALRFLHLLDGYALVTDIGWIRESRKLAGFLLPWPLRVFSNDERDKAIDWLRSLPEGPSVSHRLLPDSEVLVVEVSAPLRIQDFDALALTADTWLNTHHAWHGIVIHTRQFPGWENIGGLLRHVRFVRDHYRKINRLALAADSTLATLAPRLAEHFVHAEVRSFKYDELDSAVAWAANPACRRPEKLAPNAAFAEQR